MEGPGPPVQKRDAGSETEIEIAEKRWLRCYRKLGESWAYSVGRVAWPEQMPPEKFPELTGCPVSCCTGRLCVGGSDLSASGEGPGRHPGGQFPGW